MGIHHSNLPDSAALLTVLGQASDLCRKLDLPKDAVTFDSFIARFQKEQPTYEALRNEVYPAVNGLAGLRIVSKLKDDHSEYRRLQLAFGEIAFPGSHEKYKEIETEKKARGLRKAIRESEAFWQLDGESDLYAATIPDPPKAGAATTVRLTHSNSCGPIDDVEFLVRVGDPDKPTDPNDLDSATDWVQARLVEEVVTIGNKEMLRSEAQEPLENETLWEGTYDAQLIISAGSHSIEIKIITQQVQLLRSLVLTGWTIEVG